MRPYSIINIVLEVNYGGVLGDGAYTKMTYWPSKTCCWVDDQDI